MSDSAAMATPPANRIGVLTVVVVSTSIETEVMVAYVTTAGTATTEAAMRTTPASAGSAVHRVVGEAVGRKGGKDLGQPLLGAGGGGAALLLSPRRDQVAGDGRDIDVRLCNPTTVSGPHGGRWRAPARARRPPTGL